MDECESTLIVWVGCMDGLVTISDQILCTHPNWTGDNEWTNPNLKHIISIVWMDCVDGLMLMIGKIVWTCPMGTGENE